MESTKLVTILNAVKKKKKNRVETRLYIGKILHWLVQLHFLCRGD